MPTLLGWGSFPSATWPDPAPARVNLHELTFPTHRDSAITAILPFAPVAQLDRASAFEAEGWGFDSLRARCKIVIPFQKLCSLRGSGLSLCAIGRGQWFGAEGFRSVTRIARRENFREMSTAVVVQLGIGFVLCLCFPAGPPRYYEPFQHGVFTPPHLHSFLGIFELQQGAFDSADPIRTRSAFPSLHCSLAFLTLMYAHRFGSGVFPRRPRLYFWICLPLVISLWLSTIYLRHHWVPDIARSPGGSVVGSDRVPC